ncbi:MAG: hypothetical protein SPJ06_02975 [Bacilli bacterium]|nr:hypothetical protein [Bacilli bacterium]
MKKHNISKLVLCIVTVLMLISFFLPDNDVCTLIKTALWIAEFVLIIIALRDKSSVLKIVLLTVLALMLMSWILPAAYYSEQYTDQGRVQMGFFDLFNYPVTALSYFGYIAFFVLAIGGFYGILNKIPAYRTFLDNFVGRVQGHEVRFFVVIMLLIAALVSLGGMQIPLLVFFPMLVSVILLLGYDKIVAAMVLVGSTAVGLIGSTYAYGNTNIIMTVLSLDITSEVIAKLIILLLGLALLVLNVLLYIKKTNTVTKVIKKDSKKSSVKEVKAEVKEVEVKKTKKTATKSTKDSKAKTTKANASKSNASKSTGKKNTKSSSKKNIKAALKDEEVIVVKESVDSSSDMSKYVQESDNSYHTTWPLVTAFVLLFILVIFAFIPWSNGFGFNLFSDVTSNVLSFEIGGFAIFSKLFGTINAFGFWTIIDLLLPMTLLILFLAIVYKVKFNDILKGFMDGIKRALPLGLITILIYSCLVIVTYHPFQLVIYKALLSGIDKFNVFGALLSSLTALLAGIFNVDPSYAFQSVLLYLTSVVTDSASYSTIGVIFQAMYGFGVIFAPTSFILMIVLEYLDIPYTSWIKAIWKFLLELLAVLLIAFIIVLLV